MTNKCVAPRGSAGFTLMETLVVLVLVSLTVLVMFQMLGSYRLASERVADQAGGIDRRALVDAWVTDSVRGLQADARAPREGRADRFSGITLNPVFAPAGAPTPVEWRVEREGGDWALSYSEDGSERWRLPLRDGSPRFVYYARDGREASGWPPEIGVQDALPGSIALVQGGQARIASVLGPVQERREAWQLETE
jgi:general secretion pathway protein J